MKKIIILGLSSLLIFAFNSCASFGEFGGVLGDIAAASGVITQDQAASIGSASKALEKAFETLTPEQEYYLGRAVAANLIDSYGVVDDPAANRYLNELGQSLAMFSEKPYTFNGYRFILLDSPQINAFATPGGFILVTRGMLECAVDEGTLAAVLAHEIAHVQLEHGVKAIKTSRWTDAITKTAIAGAAMSSTEIAEATQAFEGSISDITQTLVVGGYSREQEKEADEAGAHILAAAGYDPNDLILMLKEMHDRWDPHGGGFADTHPSPVQRRDAVLPELEKLPVPSVRNTPERDARYIAAFSAL